MRPPTDMPRRPRRTKESSRRGRGVLVAALVVAFLLITSLRGIAGFYTDYLWFDSLDLGSVWRGVLGAKTALALIFTAVFFVLMWTNLLLADRIAPRFRPAGPEEEFIERYHELVGRRAGLLRTGVSLLIALIAGVGVSSQWQSWILFTNRVDFGETDATFHTDIGFYVFQLPFLRFVSQWLFSSLIVVLIATVIAHYLNGGIRVQTTGERVTPQVKVHVSVLLALLSLVKAGQYWLDRYELVFSTRGTVDGATYTDVNVQLTSIYLLIAISLFALVLFLVNIRRRGWVLPVIAVGLWGLVAVLAGEAVPAFVQRFRVQPAESAKEAPYIANNIAATRAALDLRLSDDVEVKQFAADGELTGTDLMDNVNTVENIRLWDPEVIRTVFERTQGSGLRPFYGISDVDVDRYEINGEVVQVNVAARELASEGVPQKSWEALHLTYTHGYGAVLSPTNARTAGGQPELSLQDVPVRSSEGAPSIEQAAIYIGEGQTGYVITNSGVPEIDFQDEEGTTQRTSYEGKDGIPLDSVWRRIAFSARFGDIDPLISSNVDSDSKILIQRDVRERLQTAAPFLAFDSDPYPVVIGGRVQWLVDAYTTTQHYPNAQRAETIDLPSSSGLNRRFNYVRNSVKAAVDAYDGTIALYVIDDTDPLVRAYRKAFPELFTDGDEVPAELERHFRYPEDLFRVQTTMWGRYHTSDPVDFYNRNDEWNVAPDPELQPAEQPVGVSTSTTGQQSTNVSNQQADRIDPYYLQMRLPGEEEETFLILRPFVPSSRANTSRGLTAFMVAKSDPDDYGTLESFKMPSSRLPAGPQNVASAINADTEVSRELTLLCQQTSQCPKTNLLVIPIEQSLLYVRPLYIESEANPVPQLARVIVAFERPGGNIEVQIADTLDDALTKLFGTSPGTLEEPPPPDEADSPGTEDAEPDPEPDPEPPPSPDETALIVDIETAFDAAEAAQRAGDFATFAAQIEEAERLFRQLVALRENGTGGTASPDGSTTTTTAPPPSTTNPSPTTSPPPTTAPTTTTAPEAEA